ncbi:MAG: dephospho-CoA kinase [Eubacteriales bacterium]
MSIRVIGITGPSGAGKGALCGHLRSLGVPCIDADEVYHSMLGAGSECAVALETLFGSDILSPDGSVDRRRLAGVVFSSPEKLEKLNSTVLGFVIARIESMISALEARGESLVVIDAPTLIESGLYKRCDAVISVLADRDVRLGRIMKRDGLSRELALKRINAQKADDFYISNSDRVIVNNSSEDKLGECAKRIIADLTHGDLLPDHSK